MSNDEFIQEILKHGWRKNDISTIESNDLDLPKELFELCSKFSFLSNSQENSWIYSIDYYKSKLDVAFEWDFFQKSSLECAMSPKQIEDINSFWNKNIPFAASVKVEYSYISYNKDNGSIWIGMEPEYEESAEEICTTLDEFKNIVIDHLNGKISNPLLENFF